MTAPEPALSSLVITLAPSPALRAAALHQLSQRPDLQLGQPGGCWVPAVLDSTDPYGAFRELEALPGVTLVEVVFVQLPESAAVHPAGESPALPGRAA